MGYLAYVEGECWLRGETAQSAVLGCVSSISQLGRGICTSRGEIGHGVTTCL